MSKATYGTGRYGAGAYGALYFPMFGERSFVGRIVQTVPSGRLAKSVTGKIQKGRIVS